MPIGNGFWLSGLSTWVARWGPPASSKARGKVPAIQVVQLPPETDKELMQWFQQEEVVAEVAWLGWDAATLEVVIEATGPLMQGQLEGLGGPPRWLGQASHPQLWQFSRQ